MKEQLPGRNELFLRFRSWEGKRPTGVRTAHALGTFSVAAAKLESLLVSLGRGVWRKLVLQPPYDRSCATRFRPELLFRRGKKTGLGVLRG